MGRFRMAALAAALVALTAGAGAPSSAQEETLGPYRYRIGAPERFVAWQMEVTATPSGILTTSCAVPMIAGELAGDRRCFTDGPIVPTLTNSSALWTGELDFALDLSTGALTLLSPRTQAVLAVVNRGAPAFNLTPLILLDE